MASSKRVGLTVDVSGGRGADSGYASSATPPVSEPAGKRKGPPLTVAIPGDDAATGKPMINSSGFRRAHGGSVAPAVTPATVVDETPRSPSFKK